MPVDDHPIHPKTIQADGARYGCHNHPSRKGNGYYAPNRRYLPDGRFVLELVWIATEWIEYKNCPAESDHPCCEGCVHKCAHEWIRGQIRFENSGIMERQECGLCGKKQVVPWKPPTSGITSAALNIPSVGYKNHE